MVVQDLQETQTPGNLNPAFKLSPRMSESPLAPSGVIQMLNLAGRNVFHARYHQLGDAVAATDRKIPVAEIKKNYPDLAPVIRIDSAGSVQNSDAVFYSETAPWSNLPFIADGNFHAETGGDKFEFSGGNYSIPLNGGGKIQPGRMIGFILRQGQPLPTRKTFEF